MSAAAAYSKPAYALLSKRCLRWRPAPWAAYPAFSGLAYTGSNRACWQASRRRLRKMPQPSPARPGPARPGPADTGLI